MSHNLLFLLVICCLCWTIDAEINKDENSREIAANNGNVSIGRRVTALPKFVVRMIMRLVKNIFQHLKSILQRFEKRRSPWIGSSKQNEKQNGGVISKISNLFMAPFKLAFGSVKWVPGTIIDKSTKLGVAVAGDVLVSPMFQSMSHAAVATAEKVAEETWNFAKVSIFPRMDKWVTSMKESHSLPDRLLTILTEMQTVYHLYKFLGLA
ncbi:uncharacterized protein LOC131667990 isoform X2 [Phymastichus coffea]|uniref:uncharacterized protein LOC131667990 isoform X2 n=1 Tax=Phymastichus coffea TaxID=108790 RepID=UPI00273C7BE8|nr:uncharacterized protein LOC131667990 isoform X2 [Phymastichus coffea]